MARPGHKNSNKKGVLNGKQFVSQLNSMHRQISEEAINRTIIETSTGEVIELTKKLSILKARYIASLLDIAKSKSGEDINTKVQNVRDLRIAYEELEVGLEIVKEHISDGGMQISGVDI